MLVDPILMRSHTLESDTRMTMWSITQDFKVWCSSMNLNALRLLRGTQALSVMQMSTSCKRKKETTHCLAICRIIVVACHSTIAIMLVNYSVTFYSGVWIDLALCFDRDQLKLQEFPNFYWNKCYAILLCKYISVWASMILCIATP